MTKKTELLIVDIDNTLFDWVGYYVPAFKSLLLHLERILQVPYELLCSESQQIFSDNCSIEYPFLIQKLPSVRKKFNTIEEMLKKVVEPCRKSFNETAKGKLVSYESVSQTLSTIKNNFQTPIVVLTDAPCYIALWKLNKLGLLSYFDAVYGLANPKLPTENGKFLVSEDILLKHVEQNTFGFKGAVRPLPDDYEKPGVRGLKTILMDFSVDQIEDPKSILWVGDNLRKDIIMGNNLGIYSAWAEYGTHFDKSNLTDLALFSPRENWEKNTNCNVAENTLAKPDFVLKTFDQLLHFIK